MFLSNNNINLNITLRSKTSLLVSPKNNLDFIAIAHPTTKTSLIFNYQQRLY